MSWTSPERVEGPTMRDAGRLAWRRSSRCESSGCVEVAVGEGGVLMRDSAGPRGQVLAVSRADWVAFLSWVKRPPSGDR